MLEEDIREITSIPEKEMIFGKEEKERFDEETKSWICNKEFEDIKSWICNEGIENIKVRDHCHFTGRYRGTACNACNLNYEKPNFTPVVFHNLSGYDSHLFIKNLGFSEGNIDCIPNNEERYCSRVTFYMSSLSGQSAFTCVLLDRSFPSNQSHDLLNFFIPASVFQL